MTESTTKENCSICLEMIVAETTGRVEMSCGHAHHFQCLTKWFAELDSRRLKHQCPLCRKVPLDLEDFAKPASPEPHETPGTYEWIQIGHISLDTIMRAQYGTGITQSVEPTLNYNEYDEITICREELERIIVEQGGNRFSWSAWNIMQRTYGIIIW